MRLTKEIIINAATELADRDGLSGVSLKTVAATLHTSAPALYNHINSLEALLHEVAHAGMQEMNDCMTQSAIGISGDAAIIAVSCAYFNFMIAHPGVYETIQWISWHANDQTTRLLSNYDSLLEKLVWSCQLNITDPAPVVRILKGFIHGYTTQQLGAAISNKEKAIEELSSAMEVILAGIHQKYI